MPGDHGETFRDSEVLYKLLSSLDNDDRVRYGWPRSSDRYALQGCPTIILGFQADGLLATSTPDRFSHRELRIIIGTIA